MKVAFTICSNNYLAQAKVLVDSWYENNPDTQFLIFLVDEYSPSIDYAIFEPAKVIEIRNIVGRYIHSLASRFNITELNTAVKPDIFIYLFKQNKWDKILYLDPDILLKDNMALAYQALEESNAILTPHIFTPIDDRWMPNDVQLLSTGIYNLGFLGLSNSQETYKLLNWWRNRVLKYGYRDHVKGLFYDQIWMNYAPIFFDKVSILREPGYNVANWNLHERKLSYAANDSIMVNDTHRLCFFHFSGFNYNKFPDEICSYHSRYTLQSRPDIKPLFHQYHSLLTAADIEKFSRINCVYF